MYIYIYILWGGCWSKGPAFTLSARRLTDKDMYIYITMYICMYIYMFMYIYN